MLTKILAASVFTIGLATAAMAQNAGAGNANNSAAATSSAHHPRSHARKAVVPQRNATYSIGGSMLGAMMMMNSMNSNANLNCPTGPQGASPDEPNARGRPHPSTATTVNGKHCGQ